MKNRNILIVTGILIPFFIIIWSFTPLPEKNHPVLQNIILKFENYFMRLPQQKVYLHFDKSAYKADETVWFKAYLVNAGSHKPDSSTKNLYVDLINPSGYAVQSKLIRMTNGFGNGDFTFQDTIPEGVYKIRAFTNWMRNFQEDFFFEKEFYVANPAFKTYVTREEIHKIKKENRKNKKRILDFDIQFLPEGGHLLSGIENKLGFKALNELGQGSLVSGEIINSKGIKITEFKSSDLGMGSFIFTPALNEKYTAVVNTGGDKPLKVKIPEAINMGVNISAVKIDKGKINIKLINNFTSNQMPSNSTYFLLGHCRGIILFTHEFDLKNQQNSIDISTTGFPTGIIHLSLFNLYSQPVSERLIFVNNYNFLRINLEPGKTIVSPREKMSFKMKITDKTNLPIVGNFSVSIAPSEDFRTDKDIISSLLLDSDLKGEIETPVYYFTNWNEEKEKQLDDLLLTQGWRRFSWTNVLSDVKISPKYENEKGIIISGNITKEYLSLPLRDIKVTLTIKSEFNDVFTTRSGEKGEYRFDNLDYNDTVLVSISAVRASGKHNLVINVESKLKSQDKGMNYQTNQILTHRGKEGRYAEPGMPKAEDPLNEENNNIFRLHNEPSASNIIIVDESMWSYQSVAQILEGRIPGVMVTGNSVVIRGSNSIYLNSDPLFLVDGLPVDADYAMSMTPYDIDRIEVLKGPETAIYGSQGANGVIAIYCKRGKFMIKGVLDFEMLGYYTPKEYYNPRFEYRSDDPFEDDRRTILWMPYIISDSNGEAIATFYTSDIKGNYTIKLEGLSTEGNPGVAAAGFEVK